jgi:hypothetical protein
MIRKINLDNVCVALRNASWFCHIEAAGLGFLVWDLMVSGENGLGAAAASAKKMGSCQSADVAERD